MSPLPPPLPVYHHEGDSSYRTILLSCLLASVVVAIWQLQWMSEAAPPPMMNSNIHAEVFLQELQENADNTYERLLDWDVDSATATTTTQNGRLLVPRMVGLSAGCLAIEA